MKLLQNLLKLITVKFYYIVEYIRRVALISTSILGGVCLFLLATVIFISSNILNPDFQISLLHKSNAYVHIDYTVKDTINDFIGSLPLENELLDMLTTSYMSIDNQVIEKGVNSLVVGLLEYIKGQSNILPDIYIGNQFLTTPSTDIDKINLGSILLYFNKTYIIDVLIVFRQIFKLLKPAPLIICLSILLLFGLGAISISDKKSFIVWWKRLFLSSGIISAVISFCIFIYTNKFPNSFNILNDILNDTLHYFDEITRNITESYIDGLLTNILRSTFIYTAFSILVTCILSAISRLNRHPALRDKSETVTIFKKSTVAYRKATLIIVLLIAMSLGENVYYLNRNYQLLNPRVVLGRIYSYGSISEVISAVDDTVYSLELKVNNDKTGEPISGINVRVIEAGAHDITFAYNDAYTYDNSQYISNEIADMSTLRTYLEADTDNNGTANIMLNKGLYKLEISSAGDDYILPEPFIVDIKLAGKNTISLSVSSNEE